VRVAAQQQIRALEQPRGGGVGSEAQTPAASIREEFVLQVDAQQDVKIGHRGQAPTAGCVWWIVGGSATTAPVSMVIMRTR
jgi:hypothetical protein